MRYILRRDTATSASHPPTGQPGVPLLADRSGTSSHSAGFCPKTCDQTRFRSSSSCFVMYSSTGCRSSTCAGLCSRSCQPCLSSFDSLVPSAYLGCTHAISPSPSLSKGRALVAPNAQVPQAHDLTILQTHDSTGCEWLLPGVTVKPASPFTAQVHMSGCILAAVRYKRPWARRRCICRAQTATRVRYTTTIYTKRAIRNTKQAQGGTQEARDSRHGALPQGGRKYPESARNIRGRGLGLRRLRAAAEPPSRAAETGPRGYTCPSCQAWTPAFLPACPVQPQPSHRDAKKGPRPLFVPSGFPSMRLHNARHWGEAKDEQPPWDTQTRTRTQV